MTTSWHKIPNATGTTHSTSVLTYSGGDPIGLLLALTYSSVTGVSSTITGVWTDVAKPTGNPWTDVPKAT